MHKVVLVIFMLKFANKIATNIVKLNTVTYAILQCQLNFNTKCDSKVCDNTMNISDESYVYILLPKLFFNFERKPLLAKGHQQSSQWKLSPFGGKLVGLP